MIDLETGIMDIEGVVMTPDSKLEDFKKYDTNLVGIDVWGKDWGIITIKKWIRSINEYGGDGKTNYRILIEEYIKYYEGGNKNDANSIISSHKKRLLSVDMKPYSAVYFILK